MSDYTVAGSMRIGQSTELPDLLDVLIAGGGPAGTVAAMRARELGLSALVIDYDDLMKRIRDYDPSKDILPSYGGGDKAEFPKGGPLVEELRFEAIHKDELVASWKALYQKHNVAAVIGTELTSLERDETGGTWTVVTWNHRTGREVCYRARSVIIAIGAGVPRRFDIPGNTEGIAFRLGDAAKYVGEPALVIGGGTSAAEAVISISRAKIEANDKTGVYWSYRADRMPKVSKALGEVFFDAYLGNGNIRYLRFSDPTAVVVDSEQREYLSIRIDRKEIDGRPTETTHLEFSKDRVVACIGEDLPVALLQHLGIHVPAEDGLARMLVTREGETSLQNVFLTGDVRGPRYLRCAAIDNQESYEKISIKRNIKAAMRDAVDVMNVIGERLGKFAGQQASDPTPVDPPATGDTAVAPLPPDPIHRAQVESDAVLISLRSDWGDEEEFPITRDVTEIGRSAEVADLAFAADAHMADRHATLHKVADGYEIVPSPDGSGVWRRIVGDEGTPLAENDQLWLGSQSLVAERTADGWQLAHFDAQGAARERYPVPETGLFVGRSERASLDPNDGRLSRRHCYFSVDGGGRLLVLDVGSKNGTFLRAPGPLALRHGDTFRIASTSLRFEMRAEVAALPAETIISVAPIEKQAPAPAADATPSHPEPPQGPAVNFQHSQCPTSFSVAPDEMMLAAYQQQGGENGKPLAWDCERGSCGLCLVEIVDGAENFEAIDSDAKELKVIAREGLDPDPARYRLACQAKINGPVKVMLPE